MRLKLGLDDGGAASAPSSSVFTVSIGAGEVGSTLTNFPVMVDLAEISVGRRTAFWTGVNQDGGNLRAYEYAGGPQLPLDIVTFNYIAQTGTIWVKVPSITAAGGSFILKKEDTSFVREARGATYGSAAVWSDYASVFVGGESNDDRASTSRVFGTIGESVTFLNVGNPEFTFTADPHQGIAWHQASGDVYTSDNNVLRRFSSTGTLLTSNTDPSGQVEALLGTAALGHCCDPCIVNDWLIVPINNYPTDTLCAIGVFDRTTLALVTATNISATEVDTSGVCWNPDTQRLLTSRWNTMNSIRRWTLNLTTGAIAADGAITLTITGGSFNDAIQGIEYWRGHYWLVDDARDEVVRVKSDGTCDYNDCPIQFSDVDGSSVPGPGQYEGICAYKDGLAVLADPLSANSYMIYSRPMTSAFGGGGARLGTANGYYEVSGLSGGTTWTMSVSGARSTDRQMAYSSFRDFSSGGIDDRATLVARFVTPNYQIQAWDNTNTWLTPGTPVNTALSTFYRAALIYSGTSRSLYVNGTLRASQSGITAKDAGYSAFTIGSEDSSNNENFDGDIAFAYLRMQAMSADWLAAEHSMLSNPAGFYTIS